MLLLFLSAEAEAEAVLSEYMAENDGGGGGGGGGAIMSSIVIMDMGRIEDVVVADADDEADDADAVDDDVFADGDAYCRGDLRNFDVSADSDDAAAPPAAA